MSEKRGIIGAGNWIVDRIMQIDRWPGEGNLCNILSTENATGGGPANVLFDLAAMTPDIPLYAAGCVGDDADGDYLRAEAEKRNINVDYLLRTAGKNSSFSEVMSGEGKRTFFHCRGANAEFSPEDLANIDFPAKMFYLGYLLLLDKLDEADPEYGTQASKLLAMMQKKGYYTAVDLVSEAPDKFNRIVIPALRYIDALIINEVEAGNAFGLAVRRSDDSLDMDLLRQAAEKFLENGVRDRVVVHYPEGAFALTASGECETVKSFKVEHIVGSNGAGDAFCAGVIYAMHENLPLKETLLYGAASAHFNLGCASASGGAVAVEKLEALVATAK